jgi:hypothetical protein
VIATLCSKCELISISKRDSPKLAKCARTRCRAANSIVSADDFDALFKGVLGLVPNEKRARQQYRDGFARAREAFVHREDVWGEARKRHASEPWYTTVRDAKKKLKAEWREKQKGRREERVLGLGEIEIVLERCRRDAKARDVIYDDTDGFVVLAVGSPKGQVRYVFESLEQALKASTRRSTLRLFWRPE